MKIDHAKVIELHRDGHPVEKIAQTLGCSTSSVYRILRDEGEARSPDSAKILALHAQGLTQREVAAQLGISPATVGKYVREEGTSRAHGPRPLEHGLTRAIIDLAKQGFSRQEIAQRAGVSPTTVFKYLKEAGLIREPMPTAEIVARHQAGETMTQIAKDAGVSVAAISARLKKYKQI